MGMNVEIVCSACGADALLRREPVYEGFKKTGERLLCSACGHEFASEDDVPFKEKRQPALFTEADRPEKVEVFRSDEKGHNCRHCEHYVVNPFVQRCAIHHREVEATDLCRDFVRKEDQDNPEEGPCPVLGSDLKY